MGATIASVLNGYEDPRISIYYNPATLAEHTEEYLGIPQGVYAKDGDPNYYQSYSFINTQTITASTPAVLLTALKNQFQYSSTMQIMIVNWYFIIVRTA